MSMQLVVFGLILIANFSLGAVALLRNPKGLSNQLFVLMVVAINIWMTASFFEDAIGSTNLANIFLKIDFGFAPVVALAFFAFTNVFTEKPIFKSRPLLIVILVAAAIASWLGADLVVITSSISTSSQGVNFQTSGLEVPYDLLLLIPLVAGLISLFIRFRHSQGKEKTQVRIVFTGLFAWVFLILISNLVLPQLLKIPTLSRIGLYATVIYIGFTAYAIVKHQLFDIRAVIARSVAYILLLATLGGIYSLGLFAISDLLLGGNTLKVEQIAINMGLSLILVLTFQPLRRFFERLTDKIFYRDRYDSQMLLNQITQVLASEIELGKILDKTLTMIAQAVRVNFGQYIIFEEGKVYKVEHYGKMPEQLISAPELKVLNRSMLIADELEAGDRKDVMDKHGIRLSLVLRTKDEFVGFLLLGDKLSGDIYSTQDIELFEILANELAVAIVNAKAYEEIAQFNITLQDKVNQATSRLRTANKHLKDLDAAKDEFISMASHQLRTPLTTIKGYISMLQEGDAGKISKEQRNFLAYAYDGSERMVGLISDLLNVSRMNSGKFMIDRTDVDPVAMVADEVRQLVSHAEAKQLKLIWTPPKTKIPHVQLDDNKTRQVIMNFIDNAIYYTKTGSVTVTLAQIGQDIELRVTDTGIGVPKEAQAKLFSKFFRAGNAQQVRPDGTGLGLYLAKRVVEDQGGQIIFESHEGKGSTFGFRLPMKAPVTTEKPAATPTQGVSPSEVVARAKAASKAAVAGR